MTCFFRKLMIYWATLVLIMYTHFKPLHVWKLTRAVFSLNKHQPIIVCYVFFLLISINEFILHDLCSSSSMLLSWRALQSHTCMKTLREGKRVKGSDQSAKYLHSICQNAGLEFNYWWCSTESGIGYRIRWWLLGQPWGLLIRQHVSESAIRLLILFSLATQHQHY